MELYLMVRLIEILVRNLLRFDNSSASHTYNCKNNFLGERDIFGINGSFGAPKKKCSIKFSKAKTRFCFRVYITIMTIVICLLMENKSISIKLIIKRSTFQLNFALEAYLINLTMSHQKKYHLKEMCMIFQSITMPLINLNYSKFTHI